MLNGKFAVLPSDLSSADETWQGLIPSTPRLNLCYTDHLYTAQWGVCKRVDKSANKSTVWKTTNHLLNSCHFTLLMWNCLHLRIQKPNDYRNFRADFTLQPVFIERWALLYPGFCGKPVTIIYSTPIHLTKCQSSLKDWITNSILDHNHPLCMEDIIASISVMQPWKDSRNGRSWS